MSGRADNHDGSCREVLSGRHQGKWRVQYTQTESTGKRRRLSRLFATKTAAKAFLQDARRGSTVEKHQATRALTLGTWFDWIAENDWPDTIAAVTLDNRRNRFNKHVRGHLGHVPLTHLDPMVIRSFFVHLRQSGVGEATIEAVRGELVRLFSLAVTPYQRVLMTIANPFRLPLAGRTPRAAVALTPVQAWH